MARSTKLGAQGKPEVLVSLLGRIAARNLETAVVADWSIEWVNELTAAAKAGDVEAVRGERRQGRRRCRYVGGSPRRPRPLDVSR